MYIYYICIHIYILYYRFNHGVFHGISKHQAVPLRKFPADSACKGSACPIGTRAMRCMRCTISRTTGSSPATGRPQRGSPRWKMPKMGWKGWNPPRKMWKLCFVEKNGRWISNLGLQFCWFHRRIQSFSDQKEWNCAETCRAGAVIHSELLAFPLWAGAFAFELFKTKQFL